MSFACPHCGTAITKYHKHREGDQEIHIYMCPKGHEENGYILSDCHFKIAVLQWKPSKEDTDGY